jgi:hypothetical protein
MMRSIANTLLCAMVIRYRTHETALRRRKFVVAVTRINPHNYVLIDQLVSDGPSHRVAESPPVHQGQVPNRVGNYRGNLPSPSSDPSPGPRSRLGTSSGRVPVGLEPRSQWPNRPDLNRQPTRRRQQNVQILSCNFCKNVLAANLIDTRGEAEICV